MEQENGHSGGPREAEAWRSKLLGQVELEGAKLRAEINRQARVLRSRVEAYLEETPGLSTTDYDRHIRDDLVRPAVEHFNRTAQGRERLPHSAVAEIFSRLRGLGPLDVLLGDETITEIIVDGPGKPVYVERRGKIGRTQVTLTREEILLTLERMQAGEGQPLSAQNPIVEVRLANARVNALHTRIDPLDGPSMTIRLRSTQPLTGEQLIRDGMLPAQVFTWLSVCLAAGANMVIAGPTGSGKTTLMQALLLALPPRRIITVEDPIELALGARDWTTKQLEVQHADSNGNGAVSARALVRQSLRMRPEVLAVGEVTDGVAWDMVDAMSLGHEGSVSTVHAGSPRGTLSRLERLCLRAEGVPALPVIQASLAEAINLIVVVRLLRPRRRGPRTAGEEGTRVVTAISEVRGLQGDVYTVEDLFTWQDGALRPTGMGLSAALMERIEAGETDLPNVSALGGGLPGRPAEARQKEWGR